MIALLEDALRSTSELCFTVGVDPGRVLAVNNLNDAEVAELGVEQLPDSAIVRVVLDHPTEVVWVLVRNWPADEDPVEEVVRRLGLSPFDAPSRNRIRERSDEEQALRVESIERRYSV